MLTHFSHDFQMWKMIFFWVVIPLEWNHMSILMSQITSNMTVCSPRFKLMYIKKISKIIITGPLWGESSPPVTGGFPSQRASNAQSVSMSWHHGLHLAHAEWTQYWRHQMETFSASLALCVGNSLVTSEFPSQRSVMRGFDVFFNLDLNKRLSKQS